MNKKKIIVILLLIVGFSLCVLSIVIHNTSNNKKNMKDVVGDNLYFIDITDNLDNVSYNNKKIKIEIKQDESSELIKHVYINNIDAYKTNDINVNIEKIIQFDEYIIIISNGLSENQIKLYIYKNNGSFVKEIRDLIIDNMKIASYEIFEDKITFKGMRLATGHVLLHEGEPLDICDEVLLDEKKIDKESIVSADFILSYDAENEFTINMIENSKILLSDYSKDYCNK